MKFYQRRSVALIVLVLSILGASVYGLMKKPVDLPEVKYMNWIADEAELLSAETENIIKTYNNSWTGKYGQTSIAVVTMESIKGWKHKDFAYVLGNEWGLGTKDMLLLVVENDDYYVALGDTLLEVMTDTQLSKLKDAIELDYYDDDGNYDDAVVSFFRQADVFYAQALSDVGGYPAFVWEDSAASARGIGKAIFGIIVVVILLFAVWALLDRVRYNRYRRRVIVTPGIPYYPIFWGRPRPVVRPASPAPPPGPQTTYRPSGSSHTTTTRSSSSTTVRRNNSSSFGNGGFGGGSRSSGSRSSGGSRNRSIGSRGGSFGKGGFGGGRR